MLKMCLGLIAALAAAFIFLEMFEKHVESRVSSPDGSRTVLIFLNLSESAPAPYGFRAAFSKWYLPASASFENPFFASHCAEAPTVDWIDNKSLKLRCITNPNYRPAVQLSSFEGVSIEYDFVPQKTTIP